MAAILQLLFAKVLHPPRPPVGRAAMQKLRVEATSLAREARAMHANEADDLAAMAVEVEHLLAEQEAHVGGRT
jgi:hypothetical protein